jgi:hypothetical protein
MKTRSATEKKLVLLILTELNQRLEGSLSTPVKIWPTDFHWTFFALILGMIQSGSLLSHF